MPHSSSSSAESNPVDNALAAAHSVLVVVTNVASSVPVPYLQAAASLVVTILESIQGAKDNKDGCKDLIEHIYRLLDVIETVCKDGKRLQSNPPQSLLNLVETLKKIKASVEKQNSHGRLTQAFLYKQYAQKIQGYIKKCGDEVKLVELEFTARTARDVEYLVAENFDKIRSDLCERLRHPDSFDRQVKARLKGTCEWSASHPMIDKWLHSGTVETSRLWLYGGPGTGKSVLAAYLIEQTKTGTRTFDEAVFYAFCEAQGNVRPTSSNIISGFLRQYLVDYRNSLDWKAVSELRDSIFDSNDYENRLKQHFLSILKSFKRACFIIDGLNESEADVLQSGGLIDFLFELNIPARFLFLSQLDSAAIFKRLAHFPRLKIGMDGTTQADMEKFVSAQVDALASDFRILEEWKGRLKEGLLRMAGNMFLFIKLKVDAIRGQYPTTLGIVDKIMESLDDISPSLENMYEGLLMQKHVKWKDSVNHTQTIVRTLQWLLYSRAPITHSLLCLVAAIDIESGNLRTRDLHSSIETVVKEMLGSLVEWQMTNSGVLYATLVHSSFREYLLSRHKEPSFIFPSPMSPEDLFKTCCAVLHSSTVRKSLQVYHNSADKRRQYRGTELQRVLCQEEEWERWEHRQKGDLDEEWQWRKKEERRIRKELHDLGDEAPAIFIENQDRRLRSLQRMQDSQDEELSALVGMLHLPERELMMYALKFLPHHLSQVLTLQQTKCGDWAQTISTAVAVAAPITTAVAVLVEDIKSHAFYLIEQINISKSSPSHCDVSKIADPSFTLQFLVETVDAIERLIHPDPPSEHPAWLRFHDLYTYGMQQVRDGQSYSSADAMTIWNNAVAQSFEGAELPTALKRAFDHTTLALINLRSMELTLLEFDEHTAAVSGSSILVHTLRRTGHMLAIWVTVHGFLRTKKDKLVKVLLEDSFLYTKLLNPGVRIEYD